MTDYMNRLGRNIATETLGAFRVARVWNQIALMAYVLLLFAGNAQAERPPGIGEPTYETLSQVLVPKSPLSRSFCWMASMPGTNLHVVQGASIADDVAWYNLHFTLTGWPSPSESVEVIQTQSGIVLFAASQRHDKRRLIDSEKETARIWRCEADGTLASTGIVLGCATTMSVGERRLLDTVPSGRRCDFQVAHSEAVFRITTYLPDFLCGSKVISEARDAVQMVQDVGLASFSTCDGATAMFTAGHTTLGLSVFPMSQGAPLPQNAPRKLQFAEFIPAKTCEDDPRCKTPEATGQHIVAQVGSKDLVSHVIFADKDKKYPATIDNFLFLKPPKDREDKPIAPDGIAFIGHSLFLDDGSLPLNCGKGGKNGYSYSVGLIFFDRILVRRPVTGSDPCLDYGRILPPSDKIRYVSRIHTTARVIFVGSCDNVRGVVQDLWRINKRTHGRALVVPDLSTSPKNFPGAIDLWQATVEWERIAANLATGKTLRDAVVDANIHLSSQPSLLNKAERWRIVGDENVQLKP